jgi:antitoxin PrlF
MAKKAKADFCGCGCCKVESMVSVDERGQLVLPKEVRDKAGIKAGDKLAVVRLERNGKSSIIALIKAENLADMVKEFLGPVTRDILKK